MQKNKLLLRIHGRKRSLISSHNLKIGLLSALAMLIIVVGFFMLKPSITGYVILGNESIYAKQLSIVVNQSQEINLTIETHPELFNLNSLKITGSALGEGSFRIYLMDSKGNRYLIVDRSSLTAGVNANAITGYAVAEELPEENPANEFNISEQNISANLTNENNLIINITEAVNLTNTTQETNLSLDSIPEANPPTDLTLNLTPEINLTTNLTEQIPPNISILEFNSSCIETCSLIGLNETNYTIIIELEEGTALQLDSIEYTLQELILAPEPPKQTIIFNRTLECSGCIGNIVHPKTEINITITANTTIPIYMANLTEIYPAEWIVSDSAGAYSSVYDDNNYKLEWELNNVKEASKTYTLKSPAKKGDYEFKTKLDNYESSTQNITVGEKAKTIIMYSQFKKLKIASEKIHFKSSEKAIFHLEIADEQENLIDENITEAYLTKPDRTTEQIPSDKITKLSPGIFELQLEHGRAFTPGLYTLEARSGENTIIQQNFTWGVLALNTHKSMYLENELAKIGIGVLDSEGHMVCDADIILEITSPDGAKTTLTTPKDITATGACLIYGITEEPDYYTEYTVNSAGTYLINLTAVTSAGTWNIQDNFTVASSVDFDVSRNLAQSRIYPAVNYTHEITIKANKNYNGIIQEYVPAGFEITPQQGLAIATQGDTKILSWDVKLKKDDLITLSYKYNPPDISPEFYLLGKLTIGDWQESRYYQIASDASISDDSITMGTDPVYEGSTSTLDMQFDQSKNTGARTVYTRHNSTTITNTCNGGLKFKVVGRWGTCGGGTFTNGSDGYSIDFNDDSGARNNCHMYFQLEACAGSGASNGGNSYLMDTENTQGDVLDTTDTLAVKSIAPTWNQTPSNRTLAYLTQSFYTRVNATDDGTISQYYINDTTRFRINETNGSLENNTALSSGTYYLTVSVNDTTNAVNSTWLNINVTDTTAPTWNQTPSNRTVNYMNGIIYTRFNASDNVAISQYFLNDTSRFRINETNGSFENKTTLAIGVYYINVSVNDTSNNVNFIILNVNVSDLTAPTWNQTPSNKTIGYMNGILYTRFNATDNVNISLYFINDTTRFKINETNGSFENNTALAVGVYYINVSVNDTTNNINSTVLNVNVSDRTAPTWNQTPSNKTLLYLTDSVYTRFNATDNVNISQYFINDTTRFKINETNGSFWNNTALAIGVYYVNVSVNDTSNNINSTILNVNVSDPAPSWTDNSTNITTAYVENSKTYKFGINWTDSSGVSSSILSIDDGAGTFTNQSVHLLTNNLSVIVNETYTITGTNGTFRWKWFANDSNNRWNETDSWSMSIFESYCNNTYNSTQSNWPNWNITTSVKCYNTTIKIAGNLTVKPGGNLSVYNVTINFTAMSFDGAQFINVTAGGSLWIYDNDNNISTTGDQSIIQSGTATNNYAFWVDCNATNCFALKYSTVYDAGWTAVGGTAGVYIFNGTNIKIIGSTVTDLQANENYYGLFFNSTSNSNISMNNISSNFDDNIYLSSSLNNLIYNNNLRSSINGDGISLSSSNNNNITNNNLSSNYWVNIRLSSSLNNLIYNNNASDAVFDDGISLLSSNNNNITNNNVNSNFADGIALSSSSNNIISKNNVTSNSNYGISLSSSNNNNITNNNLSRGSTGNVYLSSSNNTLITNNEISSCSGSSCNGIYLTSSTNNNISNNNIKSNRGNSVPGSESGNLYLTSSPNNIIYYNNITDSTSGYGIYVISSNNNNITNNNVSSNSDTNIYLSSSNNTKISANDASNSGNNYGIGLELSNNTNITSNNVNSNYGTNIYLSSSSDNVISNNNATNSQNNRGIDISSGNNNNITNNNVGSNSGINIRISSSNNNLISGNNASSSQSTGDGINLVSSNNNSITNNSVNSNARTNIYIDTSNNNIILNNTLNNSGADAWGNTIEECIYLTSSSNNIISNNNITYCGFTGNGTSSECIQIDSGSDNIIRDNIIKNTSRDCILIKSNNNTFINNTISECSLTNLNVTSATGITLVDQNISKYNFTSIGLIINATGKAQLKFLNTSITQYGVNLDKDILLGNNKTFVNSTNAPGFNTTANITLLGITLTTPIPVVSVNDSTYTNCSSATTPACYNLSFSNNIFIFNVSSFTTYAAAENTTPSANVAPTQPLLYSPSENQTLTVRTPTFIWNNSNDTDGPNNLTYHIMVANDSNFQNLVINISGINQSTSPDNQTNYTTTAILNFTTYWWRVRAFDGTDFGNYSSARNFTVESSIIVSLLVNATEFGTMNASATDNTTDNSPPPLVLQNDGNTELDIIINATDLWNSLSNPNQYYRYKIDENTSEVNSFNTSGSTTSWTNMPKTNAVVDIDRLGWQNDNDTAEVDLYVLVPSDEPPGYRTSTITLSIQAS